MKKYLMMMAASAAVVLTGCSADGDVLESTQTSQSNKISFNAVANNTKSRASMIESTTDMQNLSEGFKVYADYYADNAQSATVAGFMDAIQINYQENNWVYTQGQTYYWPSEGSLNFYAVAPYSTQVDNRVVEYTSIDEYGTDTSKKNQDVVVATAANQTKSNAKDGVKLTFKHILSQIVFQAKSEGNLSVNIKSIKLHGVRNMGHYDLNTLAWQSETETANTSGTKSTIYGDYTVWSNNEGLALTTTAQDLTSQSPLLMVPQTIDNTWKGNNAEKTGQCYLEIECNISQNKVPLFGSSSTYKTLYVPFTANSSNEWKQNTKYIYTMTFGGGYDGNGDSILQPIKFNVVAVSNWEDGGTYAVDVNGSNQSQISKN